MNTCERSCGHLVSLKDHSQFLKNGNALCCSEEYMARLRQSCWIKTNSLNQDKYSNDLSPCMPDCDVVIVLNGEVLQLCHFTLAFLNSNVFQSQACR